MPRITFIEHDGTQYEIDAPVGKSLMQVAIDNAVRGIVADCGGCCTCATCHGYVDPAFAEAMPEKSEDEEMMLEGALEVLDNSRLTCQLFVTEEMEGLIVRLPESQF